MGPAESRKPGRGPQESSGRRFFFSLIPLLLGFFFLFAGCEFQYNPRTRPARDSGFTQDDAAAIRDMLLSSASSWNAGDLDGFLDDYLNSDSLTFSGPEGVTRGWEDVRERYLRTYWAPGTVRDSLSFEEIEVTSVGDTDGALALGRYLLYSRDEEGRDPASGYFSLVLRRVEGEWRIIHDHTSATPPDTTSGG
jgi:ketosteroid isomerase-like protein